MSGRRRTSSSTGMSAQPGRRTAACIAVILVTIGMVGCRPGEADVAGAEYEGPLAAAVRLDAGSCDRGDLQPIVVRYRQAPPMWRMDEYVDGELFARQSFDGRHSYLDERPLRLHGEPVERNERDDQVLPPVDLLWLLFDPGYRFVLQQRSSYRGATRVGDQDLEVYETESTHPRHPRCPDMPEEVTIRESYGFHPGHGLPMWYQHLYVETGLVAEEHTVTELNLKTDGSTEHYQLDSHDPLGP